MRRQPVRRVPRKSTLIRRVTGKAAWPVLCAVLLIGASGCAGVPERPADWSPADILPASCSIYISVGVPGNEDLVGAVGALAGGGDAVDKGLAATDRLYVGIEPAAGGQAIYAVGSGTYPGGAAGTALLFSSAWRRRKGPFPWYLNETSGMKLSFPLPGFFCMTNGDMVGMLTNLSNLSRNLSTDVTASMIDSDIYVYVPAFDTALTERFLPSLETFPAEKLFIRLTRNGDRYAMDMTAFSESEKDARVLVSALKLALLARERGREGFSMKDFLNTVSIEAERDRVYLSGVDFDEQELLALAANMTRDEGDD